MTISRLAYLVVVLLCLFRAPLALADVASAVERVGVRRHTGFTEITLRFLWPVTIKGYSPLARGSELDVNLTFLPGAGALSSGAEMPPWVGGAAEGSEGLYRALRLDGAIGDATLSIVFAREFNYVLRRGRDARSLIIAVLHERPVATSRIARPVEDSAVAAGSERRDSVTSGDNTAAAPVKLATVAPIAAATEPASPPEGSDVRPEPAATTRSQARSAPMDEVRVGELLREAEDALSSGDHKRAIALYTKLASEQEGAHTRMALEYLGVARERNGQLAHAKSVYQDYLRRFPEGEDATRVSQRLETLLSIDRIRSRPAGGLMGRPVHEPRWRVFGGWSQYYRYADLNVDRSGSRYFYGSESYVAQSSLLSRQDVTARRQGTDWALELRFGGGYLADFRDDGNGGGRYGANEVLISDASLEATHLDSGYALRVGRQYSSGEGVLGRFDGARLEVPISEGLLLSLLGGRPVDLIYDASVDESDRYFYAASIKIDPTEADWQYGFFVAQQLVDGMTDRQAVGGEFRYVVPRGSLFSLLDYDTGYGDLNTVMLIGNLNLDSRSTLGATIDYRLSPVLTTRNALIGQQSDSIDELREFYTASEIRHLARDRTVESHSATLNYTRRLSEALQFYAAVSEFEYGGTGSSGGVDGFDGTGGEYGYEVQFISTDLFLQNDSHVFSLRYYDGKNTERLAFGVNARYLFGLTWRLQPRLWIERRKSHRDASEQWAFRPSLRLQYQWARRYHLELEFGRDWSLRDIPGLGDEELGSNYFMASYRVDFEQ